VYVAKATANTSQPVIVFHFLKLNVTMIYVMIFVLNFRYKENAFLWIETGINNFFGK